MFKVAYFNNITPLALTMINKDMYKIVDADQDYEALLLRSKQIILDDVSKDVLYIGRAGAGVNNIDVEAFTKNGVVVANAPGANANAVKELVILGMLLASRDIIGGIKWMEGIKDTNDNIEKLVEDNKNRFVGPEIAGKALGVIGLGSIGVMVANAMISLGLNVYGFDPFISVKSAWGLSPKVKRAISLNEIFSNCDYITIHIPLIEKTKNYLNAKVFKNAKKGLRLLNFARGGLVNNKDLNEYIQNGTIARYITDFPCKEILNMPNTLCIPHLGASTPESEINCARMVVHQMMEYLENGNIINSVNYPDTNMGPVNSKNRLVIHNQNIPTMLGQITSILSCENINITNMLNNSKGEWAYTMIDIESDIEDRVIKQLKSIDGIVRVRVICNGIE
jgi:D-3-phosphoglycerate dehydrogenase